MAKNLQQASRGIGRKVEFMLVLVAGGKVHRVADGQTGFGCKVALRGYALHGARVPQRRGRTHAFGRDREGA